MNVLTLNLNLTTSILKSSKQFIFDFAKMKEYKNLRENKL